MPQTPEDLAARKARAQAKLTAIQDAAGRALERARQLESADAAYPADVDSNLDPDDATARIGNPLGLLIAEVSAGFAMLSRQLDELIEAVGGPGAPGPPGPP